MVFTDIGRSGLAWLMAGSLAIPRFVAIGSGSGTVAVSNVRLIHETGTRIDFTSRDGAIEQEMTWTWDYASNAVSGTARLSEFAVFDVETAVTGSCWLREGFGSLTFDGTNELQIQVTAQVF